VSFIGQHYLGLICVVAVVGVALILRFAGQTDGK
jgi:hypothetical protein